MVARPAGLTLATILARSNEVLCQEIAGEAWPTRSDSVRQRQASVWARREHNGKSERLSPQGIAPTRTSQ